MPPPEIDPALVKKEREALKKVVAHSFAANPKSVKTFGTTTLSWNVTVPNSDFDIAVQVNKLPVPPTGSKGFPLTHTTAFTLSAVTENAGRQLRKLTVTVDASDCRSKLVDAFPIVQVLKSEFDKQFSGSSKFKLRGNKTEVTLSDGTIGILVPLEIEVPDWFNADMNIGVQLAVFGFTVSTKTLNVDVKWNFFEHLASLGCTGFVQSGMELIAKEFLLHIVNNELAPNVASGFKDQANKFVEDLKSADPQKRTFVTTSLVLSPAGVTITACPK